MSKVEITKLDEGFLVSGNDQTFGCTTIELAVTKAKKILGLQKKIIRNDDSNKEWVLPELPKFPLPTMHFVQQKGVSKNLEWGMNGKLVAIRYLSGVIYTSIDSIHEMMQMLQDKYTIVLGGGGKSNRYTALRQFIKAIEVGAIELPSHTADEDPDAAFRPHLTSYSTRIADDGGKVEGSLEV